jgi:hypothetical protein
MSRTLYLNSRDSVSPNGSTFEFVLPGLGLSEITSYSMHVSAIEMDNIQTPINDYANQIKFNEIDNIGGSATLTATIPNGVYTGAQLATAVALAMTTASAATGLTIVYSGTYSSLTKKITLASSGIPLEFVMMDITYNCYRELGITSSDLGTVANATTHTGSSMVNLSGVRYVDVLSRALSTSNVSSSSTASVICRVPISVDVGSVVYYQNDSSTFLTLQSDTLNLIDIALRDDLGYPYVLDSNHPISLTLNFAFGRL